MKPKTDTKHEFVFESTGKIIYAHDGIIGINPQLETFEGYDGVLEYNHETEQTNLAPAEVIELADYMIDRWKEFKIKYASNKTITDNK